VLEAKKQAVFDAMDHVEDESLRHTFNTAFRLIDCNNIESFSSETVVNLTSSLRTLFEINQATNGVIAAKKAFDEWAQHLSFRALAG
jgi:hypothetical protein